MGWITAINSSANKLMEGYLIESNIPSPEEIAASVKSTGSQSSSSSSSSSPTSASSTLTPPPVVSKADHQGYLMKKGNNVIKDWKRRWVVIKSGSLYYYEDETSPQPLGVLSLLLSTVKRNKARDTFEMILPNRIYYFKAMGKGTNEMTEWMEAIRKASEKTYSELGTDKRLLREEQGLSASSSSSSLASSSPSSPSSNANGAAPPSPSASAAAAAEAFNDKKMLNQIINSDPLNQVCVDCSEPFPRWASINLGVFFCIECSGIHRSLGVQISQVRSVDLDTWEADTVEFMRIMGNCNSNRIFEHNLASSTDAKPEPRTPREAKELFIFAKYVELKHADTSLLPQEFLDLRRPDKPQTLTTTQQAGHKKFFKCGWMQKCGGSVKTWKRRWFVLKITASSGNLFYYRNKEDPSPAGYINIMGTTTRVATSGGRDFAFELVTPDRVYQIVADNSSDMSAWITTIREAAEFLHHSLFPSFYLPAGSQATPQPRPLAQSQSLQKNQTKLGALLEGKFRRDASEPMLTTRHPAASLSDKPTSISYITQAPSLDSPMSSSPPPRPARQSQMLPSDPSKDSPERKFPLPPGLAGGEQRRPSPLAHPPPLAAPLLAAPPMLAPPPNSSPPSLSSSQDFRRPPPVARGKPSSGLPPAQ